MKILSAALAAAMLFAAPAFARSEPVSIHVSPAGLDLSRQSDVQRLRVRVRDAIAEACNPRDSYYAQLTPDHDCVIKFRSQANAIVQKMALNASSTARYVQK